MLGRTSLSGFSTIRIGITFMSDSALFKIFSFFFEFFSVLFNLSFDFKLLLEGRSLRCLTSSFVREFHHLYSINYNTYIFNVAFIN